jgi:hypothetical protein
MQPGDQVSLNPQPIPPGAVAITAVVAVAISAALGAWGSFGDNGDFGDYWPVLIIIAFSPRSSLASLSPERCAARGRRPEPG